MVGIRIATLAVTLGAVSWAQGTAAAETASEPLPGAVVDGRVNAVERVGPNVYLGGSFRRVGPRTGPAVPLSADTGTPLAGFPELAGGAPAAVAADGAGGWYVGGAFTAAAGEERAHLVHVLADGSLDPNFRPLVDGQVHDIAIADGAVYFIGHFVTVGGQRRFGLAAVDGTTGDVLDWDPAPDHDNSFPFLDHLEALGSTIYVSGRFTEIGGAPRHRFGAVSASSGQATSFQVQFDPRGGAGTLAGSGDTLYLGGGFSLVNGVSRDGLAAVDAQTGEVRAWDPGPVGPSDGYCCAQVLAIEPSGAVVFVGGTFDTIGSARRRSVAATDAATGAVTAWDAGADKDALVQDIAVGPSAVYLAGSFNQIGGRTEPSGLAAVSPTTASAAAIAWRPATDGGGRSVELSSDGRAVYVSGGFTSTSMVERAGMAALDALTGQLLPWQSPIKNAFVSGMEAYDDTIYVGGRRPAAVDVGTGALRPWEPSAFSSEPPLRHVWGATRRGVLLQGSSEDEGTRLTLVDHASARPTAVDLRFRFAPKVAAIAGNQVYVARWRGGDESVVEAIRLRDGAPCWRVRAAGSSGADPDAPPASNVLDIEPAGDRIYLGGFFTRVDNQSRAGLAAVSARSGKVLSWPGAGETGEIAAAGPSVYVAGIHAGGLSELRAVDGLRTGFRPLLAGGMTFRRGPSPPWVYDLEPAPDGLLHLGGDFTAIGTANARGYAAFSGAPANWAQPTTPDCADSIPPSLRLTRVTRSVRRALRSGVAMRVRTNEAAKLALRLTVSGRETVGRRRIALRARRARTVRVPLSRRARRTFARARRIPLTITARAADTAGNKRRPARRRVVLRRR